MSVSAYSKKKDLALTFLAWFSKSETQRRAPAERVAAQLGGLTTYKSVLAVTERHWHAAAGTREAGRDEETPQAAMDAVAREHAQILAKK